MIGNKIRIVRQIKGISQEAMAMKLMISQPAYSKIENGKIVLSPERLEIILNELNISEETIREFNPIDILKK
ncbi:MAG TPA: helix-turn-helix transcriptional regulator [Bacteroidia bacterium]|jgi:transcriptional regulator with XRE-family HTH domain|nr:helix-turn-helix transcriptional regulator [Bacteroidia bacterium]